MGRRLLDALTNDLLLKLTALGLAFLLWTTVTTPEPVAIDGVPVRVVIREGGWALHGDPTPATVTVEFSGPLRQLVRVATERPPVIVTVDQVTDTIQTVQLRSTSLAFEPGMEDIRVEAIRPLAVTLRFDRITSRSLPISVALIGAPVPGFELGGPVTVEPPAVRAMGPSQVLQQLDTLRLAPINLSQLTDTDTLTRTLENLPRDVTADPPAVSVIVPIRPVAVDSAARADTLQAAPGPSARQPARGTGS